MRTLGNFWTAVWRVSLLFFPLSSPGPKARHAGRDVDLDYSREQQQKGSHH